MIEKIAGINALKNLKILSLGRNYIKNFAGLVRFCGANFKFEQSGSRKDLQTPWKNFGFLTILSRGLKVSPF